MNERGLKLFEFVKEQHGDQLRKYTNKPYWTHLENVAKTVSTYMADTLAAEVALCHDLFEDTNCYYGLLEKSLRTIGYEFSERTIICDSVNELTDQYTTEKYPNVNRAKRKQMEAERLSGISYLSQSVKYADLIDNTFSIISYDVGFAEIYLKEKHEILNRMRAGNIDLFIRCCSVFYNAKSTLLQRHDIKI